MRAVATIPWCDHGGKGRYSLVSGAASVRRGSMVDCHVVRFDWLGQLVGTTECPGQESSQLQ